MLLAAPLLILSGGWLGSLLPRTLGALDYTTALADRVWTDAADGVLLTTDRGDDAGNAWRTAGKPDKKLFASALERRRKHRLYGWIVGGFIGLILALKLLDQTIWRTHTDYEPDRARCLSCARCFDSCPYELVRKGIPIEPEKPDGQS